MNKIVINNCYGGFSLSTLAIKRYYELKYPEVQLFFYKLDFPLDSYKKVPMEKTDVILTKDLGDYFTGPLEEDYLVTSYCISRHDPILVQVVEELGEKAGGRYAELKIVEIPGNKYRIGEYDGQEWVETPESIDWVTIP
jgi:hypothetical protein